MNGMDETTCGTKATKVLDVNGVIGRKPRRWPPWTRRHGDGTAQATELSTGQVAGSGEKG
jgi:hypothetical protein